MAHVISMCGSAMHTLTIASSCSYTLNMPPTVSTYTITCEHACPMHANTCVHVCSNTLYSYTHTSQCMFVSTYLIMSVSHDTLIIQVHMPHVPVCSHTPSMQYMPHTCTHLSLVFMCICPLYARVFTHVPLICICLHMPP